MTPSKPHLVILGTGFGGFSLLQNIGADFYDVTVISPRNHFLFTPLLPSTTVGTVEFRSIIEPIRSSKRKVQFYQASCEKLDTTNKKVFLKNPEGTSFELSYDFLVIAVGATNQTYDVPGVKEHALFLKEVPDARAIRQKISDCFEQANTPDISLAEKKRLLHFVIVGGGPTGVEFAAELHDFIDEDIKKLFPELAPLIKISLLEAGDKILNSFDQKLSEYTLHIFKRQNIEVKLGSLISEVHKKSVLLKTGEEIPCGLVVWSTGIGPNDFVKSLSFKKDKTGKILVDNTLKILGDNNIYAIGDCTQIQGQNLPATAQVAQSQGKFLAKNLMRLAKQKTLKNYKFQSLGMLAYVGGKKALADLPHLKGRGFMTYLFWRYAYLTKLVSFKNKIQVLFDWARKFLFGRDISRF